jgi:hypothetical protein
VWSRVTLRASARARSLDREGVVVSLHRTVFIGP